MPEIDLSLLHKPLYASLHAYEQLYNHKLKFEDSTPFVRTPEKH